MVVDHAKGVHFWDVAGKRYLDFASQAVNVNIGHADDRVIQAMKEQLDKVPYISPFLATDVRGELGERLARLAPGRLNVSFFTLGGAEANENAIRVAFSVTGRRKILARYRSYHGATSGALAMSGDPRRWAAEPALPGVVRFWGPYPYRCRTCGGTGSCTRESLDHLEDVIIHEGPHTIAALILEPVPGGYGAIVPPADYLRGVRELCDRYGILLIADEVMTGFGRTGEWFAVDHEDVEPDIMTVSKGLTSGHAPLGACILSDDIAGHFSDNPFPGGLTFQSYPLGCAAALAAVGVVEEDDLVGNSRRLGKVLGSELEELRSRHPSIGEARNIGLMGAVELVADRETREPLGSIEGTSPHQHVGAALKAALLEDGLFVSVRGPIVLITPPLSITEDQLREGLEILGRHLHIADREVSNA